MIPYLSREQWLSLERESFVVDTSDRSMIKVAGHGPASIEDIPGFPADGACPILFGQVLRSAQPIARQKAALPFVHRFEEDRWCEVDADEIYNVFFFAPEWLPLLPRWRPEPEPATLSNPGPRPYLPQSRS